MTEYTDNYSKYEIHRLLDVGNKIIDMLKDSKALNQTKDIELEGKALQITEFEAKIQRFIKKEYDNNETFILLNERASYLKEKLVNQTSDYNTALYNKGTYIQVLESENKELKQINKLLINNYNGYLNTLLIFIIFLYIYYDTLSSSVYYSRG